MQIDGGEANADGAASGAVLLPRPSSNTADSARFSQNRRCALLESASQSAFSTRPPKRYL